MDAEVMLAGVDKIHDEDGLEGAGLLPIRYLELGIVLPLIQWFSDA